MYIHFVFNVSKMNFAFFISQKDKGNLLNIIRGRIFFLKGTKKWTHILIWAHYLEI